eukprot:GHRR01016723.1.p1 GENE.GHRR01016723.1~~GHRR01016723.1.p1  ORF type:complete len:1310 (+),score=476.87 GHRR01016723.1:197-4126(+)
MQLLKQHLANSQWRQAQTLTAHATSLKPIDLLFRIHHAASSRPRLFNYPSNSIAAKCSTQSHMEIANQGQLPDSPLPTDSIVEAFLTAESESESDDLLDTSVLSDDAPQIDTTVEENPYTPNDALSEPWPSRYGVLPASPELETFLQEAAEHDGDIMLDQLQRLFPFRLDGFQEKAVQQLLEGRSVVVCAPTGAGKTAIAEAAAAAALARGQRVIYTTPLKALSNQKLAETAARFGSSRCGLQTGDTSLNTEADIVVMTTEILRNIMYRTAEVVGSGRGSTTRDERLGDVGLIVLDEVHYLGDPWRGSVWEEVIINCPRNIQMLAMSATVKNPDDLGGWISQVHGECVTIKTRFRPVPLRWMFCHKAPRVGAVLEDLLAGGASAGPGASNGASLAPSAQVQKAKLKLNTNLRMEDWVAEEVRYQAACEARQAQQRSRESAEQAYDPLDPLGLKALRPPELSKPGKRRSRESDRQDMVRKVMAKHVPQQEQVTRQLQRNNMLPAIWFILSRRDCDLAAINSQVVLVSEQEEAELVDELQQLRDDNPDAVRIKLVPAFLRGVASHHAGCLPAWKSLVERCFQKGLLKLVFATGTLAAGINMPARTTIISNLARRSDEGLQLLPHNELLQMAGRAGRRGYDTQGHCVLVQGRFEGADAAHTIITTGPEPLQSQFTTSYSLVLNLLSAYSLDEAREFLSKSFGTYLSQEVNNKRLQQAKQYVAQSKELMRLAEQHSGGSEAQRAAAAVVKRQQSLLRRLRDRAILEQCAAVRQQLLSGLPSLLEQQPASTPLAVAPVTEEQQQQQEPAPAKRHNSGPSPSISSSSSDTAAADAAAPAAVRLPALVLLNLSRHPNDETKPAKLLPALAVREMDSPPLPPLSGKDLPYTPILACLGADNRLMAVSAQHIVGVVDKETAQGVWHGQEEALQRLDTIVQDAAADPKVWANLASKMFSCQVTVGSALTSALAVKLNLPADAFTPVGPSADTQAAMNQQKQQLAIAKQQLQRARSQENQQQHQWKAAGPGGDDIIEGSEEMFADRYVGSPSNNSSSLDDASTLGQQENADGSRASSSKNGDGSSGGDRVLLPALKGCDPMVVARRLLKQAKQLIRQADQVGQQTTWNSFMDVLGIVVKLGAMEDVSLRLLPLGLVARSINCNNELWMAAALSHPAVMELTPPQLAGFVGALQSTELTKRPMSIWSGYQVSDAVVSVIEQLEPIREAIFEAQTAAGQYRWNEHLVVDLRLAGKHNHVCCLFIVQKNLHMWLLTFVCVSWLLTQTLFLYVKPLFGCGCLAAVPAQVKTLEMHVLPDVPVYF